jgi:hypothetical protein
MTRTSRARIFAFTRIWFCWLLLRRCGKLFTQPSGVFYLAFLLFLLLYPYLRRSRLLISGHCAATGCGYFYPFLEKPQAQNEIFLRIQRKFNKKSRVSLRLTAL